MNEFEYWPEAGLLAVIAVTGYLILRERRLAAGYEGEEADLSGETRRGSLALRLRHAGFAPARTLFFFRLIRILFALFAVLWSMNWLDDWPMLIAIGLIAFFIPDLWLRKQILRRQRTIRRALSLFVDLITSLSRAGLTLEKTFLAAAREGFPRSHPLAVEVVLLGRELQFGRDRDQAFQLLAERTGVTELKALASSIRMGLRSGAPIEESLQSQADFLRFRQQEEATRSLTKATASAMVPVFLAGIPLWAVVVYFPMVLEILETVQNLNPF